MSRRRIAGVRKSAEKVHRYYYRNRGNQSGPGSAAQAGQMIGCRDYGKGTFTPPPLWFVFAKRTKLCAVPSLYFDAVKTLNNMNF